MSIELEYALEHKKDPAVLCCRMEGGNEITHHNLEDPAIFPDLIDTGLLNIDGALTIEQVLGATLKETSDSLTPLTPAIVDNIQEVGADEADEPEEEAAEAVPAMAVPAGTQMSFSGGVVKLYIAEGKDISIEFPV